MNVDVRHHRLNVLGLSVEKFAAEVGVTPDVIRNVERTGNRPMPANAVKLARYFDLTPDLMWDESPVESSPNRSAAA